MEIREKKIPIKGEPLPSIPHTKGYRLKFNELGIGEWEELPPWSAWMLEVITYG